MHRRKLFRFLYYSHLLFLMVREKENHIDPVPPSICRHVGPGKVEACVAL